MAFSSEPRPSTGYESKQLAEDRVTGDGHFTEHEDLRVKTLSFHQSIKASTYDSAESIATPLPESDLEANNFVLCWLHHCTYSSEKQVQNDRKFITLNEKT